MFKCQYIASSIAFNKFTHSQPSTFQKLKLSLPDINLLFFLVSLIMTKAEKEWEFVL